MKWYALILILALISLVWGETEMEAFQRINSLREDGKFAEAASAVLEFMQQSGESGELYYYAACFHSLAGNKESAWQALDKSVDLGFLELAFMQEDPDLVSLQQEPQWDILVGKIQTKIAALIATLPLTREKKDAIELPKPSLDGSVSLEKTLQGRRSVREYSDDPLTLTEVSQVLWAAYGVTQELAPEILRGGLKTAPSAGGTYPLEIYLAAWEVTGLNPGYYLYEPWGHKLYPVRLGDFREELFKTSYGQEWVLNAPASLIYSAVFSRTTDKYGSRGRERYVCMDLGHSGENVYLQAEALGLGTVALGAFNDIQLRLTVTMTQAEEPLYIMPLGKKLPTEETLPPEGETP